jgi:cytochrome b561
MHRRLSDTLFLITIGFVATSFVLGLTGHETSGATAEAIFRWHEGFGVLSLIALLAALAAGAFGNRGFRAPARGWLPRFRTAILAILYALLVLQPFSGWLLASLEGKSVSVFGWTLPALANPGGLIAEFGSAYHVLGGGLILLLAALNLRLNLEAYALGGLARLRRRRRALPQAPTHEGRAKNSNGGP